LLGRYLGEEVRRQIQLVVFVRVGVGQCGKHWIDEGVRVAAELEYCLHHVELEWNFEFVNGAVAWYDGAFRTEEPRM